jgi:ABC-type microcin C transport system permease subunit YejB
MNGDFFQLIEIIEDAEEGAHQQQERRRQQRRLVLERRMTDPLASISDAEFRRHFRFDKDNVRRLVDMLQPNLDIDSDRGIPLSPI